MEEEEQPKRSHYIPLTSHDSLGEDAGRGAEGGDAREGERERINFSTLFEVVTEDVDEGERARMIVLRGEVKEKDE